MKVLYFDCFSGASGDMILGALIDSGVSLEEVRRALGGLAIDPETIWTERVLRAGISATKFHVRGETLAADHADDHDHGPEPGSHGRGSGSHRHGSGSHRHGPEDEPHLHIHRTLPEIFRLIDGSGLSGAAKDRAKQLFTVLGEAESAIHGTPLERVHLHEVGALDSIIDIVGAVFALEQLGVGRIVSSPLNVGSGTLTSATGGPRYQPRPRCGCSAACRCTRVRRRRNS